MVLLRTGHRYWVISYHTFLSLSGLCGLASTALVFSTGSFGVAAAIILFLISAFWNAWVVCQLINGRYSYDYNEHFWKDILCIKDSVTAAKTAR